MNTCQELKTSKIFRKADKKERLSAMWVFLISISIIAFLILAGFGIIDTTLLFGLCGFKIDYGYPCPTCSITTSAVTFFQGHVIKSFYIQPAGGLFCGIIVIVCTASFLITCFGLYLRFIDSFFSDVKIKHIIVSIVFVILAGWAVTFARALTAN